MSSTQFNKGPSYGLSAEVKNRLQSKYDPQKEAELRSWIEGLTGLSIGPDFQKGLKDGIILCTLMNKLQPGSIPKINRSMQNWHQLENLSNFIKAMAKTKGLQSGVDIGLKYSEKQERNFDDATMKAGQCVIGLQVGMTAPGTRRHIYDTKLGTDKCDNSSMSLQMGYTQGANQSGQVFGLGRQIYDPKYCPQGPVADGAPAAAGDGPGPGEPSECPPYYQEEAGY
ncbi:CNN2 [Cervus elaphus hippelaphus]|uniref:Calponin n=1 Tax=Cervus elaphus hippelaphus TaxID=46360 RepID=A0A212D0J2_CEREH|nr:CNN2 [Cervus elaphus hippelaphus]